MRIVLASKSPRRKEILSSLGVRFDVLSADADESCELPSPEELVKELSLRKGRAVRELLCARGEWNEDTLIIASDTVVALDGAILGKPRDDAHATEMLRALSGRDHKVLSGIALLLGERELCDFDSTVVKFDAMTDAQIAWYVNSGEPRDKAGSYAVQGLASLWIKGLVGDYFNVVGLPVYRLNLLSQKLLGRSLCDLC